MSQATKEITTLMLPDTVATRAYPFTQQTLDQIRELRADREDELYNETGREHLVPAPVIIADAVAAFHAAQIK